MGKMLQSRLGGNADQSLEHMQNFGRENRKKVVLVDKMLRASTVATRVELAVPLLL